MLSPRAFQRLRYGNKKLFHWQQRQRRDFSLLINPRSPAPLGQLFDDDGGGGGGGDNVRRRSPFRPRQTQIRWKGRRDGHRFHGMERKPTKGQRRAHARRMKALAAERAKHSRPPGSRAGKKREWEAFLREDLLNRKFGEEFRDPLAEAPYDAADAILDDFMGNSAGISSQPTPEPVYLGHKHRQFYRRVADQMDAVRYYEEQVKLLEEGGDGSAAAKDIALAEAPALPTDRDVSLVLRAYRDKRGTRRHPVGLHGALRHVVGDLGVPLSAWSENTYTALITCCRTAREARRVVQLMQQHRVPVSPHAWSSLADVYAKAGDYQGCLEVHKDMLAAGVPPTLASYTSLLAACYKVCSDGRVPHSTRAEAATTAWEQWQEMRVVGLQPDAMAYGAMLRVLAIKGQAEKAMGLLEEMQMQDVKPTTLCFTSALRAVARSHAIAVRYERGSSKKMRRREHLTLHHGKMARQILIAAENAEVEQDQGFTAALIMCAASAGDVATAKAIYVASQIRQLDQFRTIGSEQHLARLRGESVGESDDDQLLTSGEPIRQIGASSAVNGSQFQTQRDHSVVNGSSDLLSTNGERAPARRKKQNKSYPSFGEREYGKDNRALTAIVHACAASVDQNGMGSMWQGRENNGYLCENSLRLINARRLPRYTDNSIPGQTIKDNLTWKGEHHELDDNYDYGKRKGKARRKFEGLDIVEDAGSTLDELDETFSRMFLDEEGRRKPEYRATEPEDIWRMKYGEGYDPEEESPAQERGGEKAMLHDGFTATTMLSASSAEESSLDGEEEMYFDNDEMKWKNRPRFDVSENIADTEFVEKSNISEQVKDQTEEELHFDLDATRWKTRPKAAAATDASAYKLTGEEMHQDEEENRSSLCSEDDTELYFDEDEMKWKTRERAARKTDYETDVLTGRREVAIHEEEAGDAKQGGGFSDMDEREFAKFFAELKAEVEESGEESVDEEEARELFLLMKDEYGEFMSMDPEKLRLPSSLANLEGMENLDELSPEELKTLEALASSEEEGSVLDDDDDDDDVDDDDDDEDVSQDEIDALAEEMADSLEMGEVDEDDDDTFSQEEIDALAEEMADSYDTEEAAVGGAGMPSMERTISPRLTASPTASFAQTGSAASYAQQRTQTVQTYHYDDGTSLYGGDGAADMTASDPIVADESIVEDAPELSKPRVTQSVLAETMSDGTFFDLQEARQEDPQLEELRQLLPAFSDRRLRKILTVFHKSLADPPLLELVQVVRERMPDYVTRTWLKQMGFLTAKFVVHKAAEEGVVDRNLLNSVLELQTSAGSLDRALEFHQTEFKKHNLEPTGYSDRLVLQMFLKNNRLPRALDFKRTVENSGRTLDLQAYGSLIDYCSRHHQLGSAMLLLKECLSNHGAPPGEASLKRLRLLCRQKGLVKKIGLTDMIGEDPLEWLREGEAERKREMSRKGRRNVNYGRNALVNI